MKNKKINAIPKNTEFSPVLLLEKLKEHAQDKPQALAYTLLNSEGEVQESLNYAELDRRACLLAEQFCRERPVNQKSAVENYAEEEQERLILLYANSLDFIVAYLGCLYAGIVAVPVSAFNKEQSSRYFPFLCSVIKDAGVKRIATTEAIAEWMRWELSIQVPEIDIICTDRLSKQNQLFQNKINAFISQDSFSSFSTSSVASSFVSFSRSSISHLQYTSGSTSTPKGVICTHENMAHSLFETVQRWQYTANSVTVAWAPHTHVYGLTTGLLVPLYSGTHSVLMSAADFLVNPLSWLTAISNYKATHSGCPNFGYEFCIEHIEEEEALSEKLNLSHWRVAANGGELVQQDTMTQFYNKFKRFGFQETAFYPAYGMSECMGLIATSKQMSKPTICLVNREALYFNRVVELENSDSDKDGDADSVSIGTTRTLISCGSPLKGISLNIVDPDTQLEVTQGNIGEIWLTGRVCSPGYWNESEYSQGTTLKDFSRIHTIQTGDLGFIKQDEVFLVGRLKELIILYGKNYYPVDIERDVKNAHKHFSKKNGVAFSTVVESMEELFILQEIDDKLPEDEYLLAVSAIRQALSFGLGIDTYAIILLPLNSIPKTGSGKIQRRQASQKYFNKEFKIVYESIKVPAKHKI